MTARCLACQHPQRQELDQRLVGSSPPNFSAIARSFDLHHEVVSRHYRHLPAALVKAARIGEVATADRIVTLVESSLDELDWVIGQAKARGDLRTVVLCTKARATQLGVLISAASLILEERKMRSPETPPDVTLAEVEKEIRRRIDREVSLRTAAPSGLGLADHSTDLAEPSLAGLAEPPGAPTQRTTDPPTQRLGVAAAGSDVLSENQPDEQPNQAA